MPQYANADAKYGGPPHTRFGPHGGCTAGGTYPFGTCSLKAAHNLTEAGLNLAADDGADAWISGVVDWE